MKRNLISRVALCGCLVLLPSCGRIVDWGKSCFVQGEKIPHIDVPGQYVRSVIQYDQFLTIARFDALWLADEVRVAYANAYSMKYGKNEQRHDAFLRRQLEENRHFISFYVLTPEKVTLGQSQSKWGVYLLINDVTYMPVEIKKVELDLTYVSFFGNKFSRFKSTYHVKFDACDNNDMPLLGKDACEFGLVFRSSEYQTRLDWTVNKQDRKTACVSE